MTVIGEAGRRCSLTATIYNFDIDFADHDRQAYETLALRVARHPSESEEYLWTRVLAYALEFTSGIEFSKGGLSDPDEPAIAVRDLTGALRAWIEVGTPDAERLHRAAKVGAAGRGLHAQGSGTVPAPARGRADSSVRGVGDLLD